MVQSQGATMSGFHHWTDFFLFLFFAFLLLLLFGWDGDSSIYFHSKEDNAPCWIFVAHGPCQVSLCAWMLVDNCMRWKRRIVDYDVDYVVDYAKAWTIRM